MMDEKLCNTTSWVLCNIFFSFGRSAQIDDWFRNALKGQATSLNRKLWCSIRFWYQRNISSTQHFSESAVEVTEPTLESNLANTERLWRILTRITKNCFHRLQVSLPGDIPSLAHQCFYRLLLICLCDMSKHYRSCETSLTSQTQLVIILMIALN